MPSPVLSFFMLFLAIRCSIMSCMSCPVLSKCVMSCLVLSHALMPSPDLSLCVVFFSVVSCHVLSLLSCYVLSCFVLLCLVLLCPGRLCTALSAAVLSCRVLLCPVIFCLSQHSLCSFPVLSCPAVSCLNCPVLSNHVLLMSWVLLSGLTLLLIVASFPVPLIPAQLCLFLVPLNVLYFSLVFCLVRFYCSIPLSSSSLHWFLLSYIVICSCVLFCPVLFCPDWLVLCCSILFRFLLLFIWWQNLRYFWIVFSPVFAFWLHTWLVFPWKAVDDLFKMQTGSNGKGIATRCSTTSASHLLRLALSLSSRRAYHITWHSVLAASLVLNRMLTSEWIKGC